MINAESYFNNLAAVYNKANQVDRAWTSPNVIYNSIKEHINEQSTIFDFGIGSGKAVSKIIEKGTYAKIYRTDVSSDILSVCNNAYPDIITSKYDSVADLRKYNNNVDILISSGVFEFIKDLDELFTCFNRMLKNDGVISFTYEPIIAFHSIQSERESLSVPMDDSCIDFDGFYTYRRTPSEVNQMLENNGFMILSDTEFVAYGKLDSNIVYHCVVVRKA